MQIITFNSIVITLHWLSRRTNIWIQHFQFYCYYIGKWVDLVYELVYDFQFYCYYIITAVDPSSISGEPNDTFNSIVIT